jgi:hypothetical protein
VILAGSCGGAFSSGRHVMYGGDPLANLFISMLDAVGVSIPTFGDNGTGKLADL